MEIHLRDALTLRVSLESWLQIAPTPPPTAPTAPTLRFSFHVTTSVVLKVGKVKGKGEAGKVRGEERPGDL